MKEDLINKVSEKLQREFNNYKSDILYKEPLEIFNSSYEIAIKEELSEMFYDKDKYNSHELKALLEQKNSLDYLYSEWMDCDGGINNVLEDFLEISLSDLAIDSINDIKEEIDNSDYKKLIINIKEVLQELDYYDFCYHLKDRYGIERDCTIEDVDVYEIFKSKGGKKYLYDELKEIKDNKDIEDLKEKYVINNELIDNIDDKILPELKSIIQKEKQQEIER